MSYIAFELDALNVCPQVGAACGLTAAEAAHGLLQLWAWCFRSEQATATSVHLKGFFGGTDAGPALEAFGFLAKVDNGWRVKGAERYLRVKASRREGARKTNEQRWSDKGANGPPIAKRRSKSDKERSLPVALTPSTEHRAPSTEVKSVAPDGAHQSLTDALCVTYQRVTGSAYPFSSSTDPHIGSRNGKAVKTLLGMGIAPTVLTAWERALRSDKFPLVRSLPELVTHFAHFVGKQATAPPSGAATAAATDWSDYQPGDTARELFGDKS